MRKSPRKNGAEGMNKGSRCNYVKGERKHRPHSHGGLSFPYSLPSPHSKYSSSLRNNSSHNGGETDSGVPKSFQEVLTHPPVFGPSSPSTYPLFIDLTTNIGYMNPFDLPLHANFPEVRIPTGTSTIPASSHPLPSKGSPHMAPSSRPSPAMPPTSTCGCSNSETPFNTPARTDRRPSQDRPSSSSPQPFPPENGGVLSGKCLFRGKIDSVSESPYFHFPDASWRGYSQSKSISEGADSSLPKEFFPPNARALGFSEAQRSGTSASQLHRDSSPPKPAPQMETKRDSASALSKVDTSILDGADSQTNAAHPLSALFPKLSYNGFKFLEDSISSSNQPSSSMSSHCPLPSTSCLLEEETSGTSAQTGRKEEQNITKGNEEYCVSVEGHFRRTSTLYSQQSFEPGTYVLFDGDRGVDLGRVIRSVPIDEAEESHMRGKGKEALHEVLHEASEQDVICWKSQQPQEAQKSLLPCQALVDEKGCQLKIVGAAYQFDMKKLTFYYRSTEPRVDFRSVLSPLYSSFHCRIWMERVEDDFSSEPM